MINQVSTVDYNKRSDKHRRLSPYILKFAGTVVPVSFKGVIIPLSATQSLKRVAFLLFIQEYNSFTALDAKHWIKIESRKQSNDR